jgi:hypothetical protein
VCVNVGDEMLMETVMSIGQQILAELTILRVELNFDYNLKEFSNIKITYLVRRYLWQSQH